MYTEVILRVPGIIADASVFIVELRLKKTFAYGAEDEGFQRLIDAVNSAIETYNGGFSSLSSDSSQISGTASSVQQQIASFLANPFA